VPDSCTKMSGYRMSKLVTTVLLRVRTWRARRSGDLAAFTGFAVAIAVLEEDDQSAAGAAVGVDVVAVRPATDILSAVGGVVGPSYTVCFSSGEEA
jgi:hypothetical protein